MKILNFGSLNIDICFRVKEIVKPGETISASSIEKRAGGKGLNQSVALAKVHPGLYHAGMIGSDGDFLKEYLASKNIDTSFIKKSEKLTGNALIQVDDSSENAIVLYKGANFDNSKDHMDEVLENFSKDDILILQNEINNLSYLIDLAYEKGMKIVLNPSPITEVLDKIDYKKIDLLMVNEIEAREISKKMTREDIISYFKGFENLKTVMTLGKRGSVFISKDKIISQDSYKVKAVDTTGAGDTFAGYFIGSFYGKKGVKESLKLASKASALAVMREGAANSIPNLKEVENFKETL